MDKIKTLIFYILWSSFLGSIPAGILFKIIGLPEQYYWEFILFITIIIVISFYVGVKYSKNKYENSEYDKEFVKKLLKNPSELWEQGVPKASMEYGHSIQNSFEFRQKLLISKRIQEITEELIENKNK